MTGVIRLLWVKNYSAEIHWQLIEIYGEKVMNKQHMAKWRCLFQSIWDDVEDTLETAGIEAYQQQRSNMPCVDELIQRDRRITLHHTASQLKLSYDSVQHSAVCVLCYTNVCARWVPHALFEDQDAS